MCVAAFGKVVEINEKYAKVDFDGNLVNARYGPLEISIGDSVLVHAGLIIQVIKAELEEEISELEKLMEE